MASKRTFSDRRGNSGVANEGSHISRLRRTAMAAAPASAADLLGTSPPLIVPASQGPLIVRSRLRTGMCAAISGSASTARRAFRSRASPFRRPASSARRSPLAPARTGRPTTSPAAQASVPLNDWLRFDATWDYSTGPGGSRQFDGGLPLWPDRLEQPGSRVPLLGYLYNTTNTCIGSASANQHNNTFLGNAYVDLGTYYGFTPYVGGGLGLNINTCRQPPTSTRPPTACLMPPI